MNDLEEKRVAAVKRIKARRVFGNHVTVYLIVNGLLIVIWAMTGSGYFWPIWPIAGWGIALALHGWTAYLQKPISEEDIRREMERG